MKIKKIKIVVLFLLVFGLQTLQAQEAVNAAGGDASGSGGIFAYSVGQIVYTTIVGTNGSVAQGVQQPYEISVEPGNEDNPITLELTIYPNPTNNFLTLNTGNSDFSTLSFQLCEINGKLINSRKITSSNETIGMENLPSAMYFLKVANNNIEVKTFKIIKN
jgi:hypothetical protein